MIQVSRFSSIFLISSFYNDYGLNANGYAWPPNQVSAKEFISAASRGQQHTEHVCRSICGALLLRSVSLRQRM
jgi:hypothetical protein